MRKVIMLSALGLLLLALGMLHSVRTPLLSKGHVPFNKAQVCHNGEAMLVNQKGLSGHLSHGDCQLPACDNNNVFLVGDDCSSLVDTTPEDDLCDFNDRTQMTVPTPQASPA